MKRVESNQPSILTALKGNPPKTNIPKPSSSPVLNKGGRRDDPTAILTSLTENLQLAPAIKTIYDRGWTHSFHAYLERSIVAKDEEIKQTCYEHYDELVSTIDYVLAAKQQVHALKSEVTKLNNNVQESCRNLLEHVESLNSSRVVHQNILLTLYTLRRISNLFFVLSQAFTQIEQRRFLIALKSLSYVQSQLPQFEHFDFVRQLEVQIPSLASFIQHVVKRELEGWLSTLRAKVPALGKFTLFTIKRKVDGANTVTRQKILLRLNSIGLYTNNYTLGNLVSSTQSSFMSHHSKFSTSPPSTLSSSQLSANSPSSMHQNLNLYTVADLTLGITQDCFTILSDTKTNTTSLIHGGGGGKKRSTLQSTSPSTSSQLSLRRSKKSSMSHPRYHGEDSDPTTGGDDQYDASLKRLQAKYGITSSKTSEHRRESRREGHLSSTHITTQKVIGLPSYSSRLNDGGDNDYNGDDDSISDDDDDEAMLLDQTIDNDVFSNLDDDRGITSSHYRRAYKMINTSVSFIPLHQCLHVFRALGQLGVFRQIYAQRRYAQAASSIDVMAPSSSSSTSSSASPSSPSSTSSPITDPSSPPSTSLSPSQTSITTSKTHQQQQNAASPSPSYLSSLTTDTGEVTDVGSIFQLNHLFSEVIGFFIIEDAVIRSDARLLTRTELDSIWERSSLRIERVLNDYINRITSPGEFLRVKHAIMTFLSAMDLYRFNTHGLTELVASKLSRFKNILGRLFKAEAEKILSIDTYEPLTIYSLEDYRNLVFNIGLTDNMVKNFPVTMPFSLSVPLMCQLIRTFSSYLFEFTMNLSTHTTMTTMVTTFISNIIREHIIDTIQTYRENISQVSVSLCVQLRVNTVYYLKFIESLLKYCQCYIDQIFSNQVELVMFSVYDDVFETQQVLDDSIAELLKTKIDMFSNIASVYEWNSTTVMTHYTDYCFDVSTFLHTTLSCMVFLPVSSRLTLSLQCFDYIVQSIIFALSQHVQSFTQVALHNLLLDITEFERLAKQLALDLSSQSSQPSSPNTPSTSPLSYHSSPPSSSSSPLFSHSNNHHSSTTSNSGGGGGSSGNGSGTTQPQTLLQAISKATSNLPTSTSMADTLKVTANHLTKSFTKIKQICELFTSDLALYLNPVTRDEKYYLVDGLLAQRLAQNLRVLPTTPRHSPPSIHPISKTDLDLFKNKIKKLLDAKQLL